MDNKEIRRKILEYLYQKDEEKPKCLIGRKELIKFIGLEERKIDSNVLYLKEMGYIKTSKRLDALFSSAQITSDGKDLVEQPEEFNAEFPIQMTQNIITDSIGVIVGNSNTQTINISDNFNAVYQEIEQMDPRKKTEIIDHVKTIEDELKKDAPNKSIMKKGVGFLRENAVWVVPSIIALIKTSFGI